MSKMGRYILDKQTREENNIHQKKPKISIFQIIFNDPLVILLLIMMFLFIMGYLVLQYEVDKRNKRMMDSLRELYAPMSNNKEIQDAYEEVR